MTPARIHLRDTAALIRLFGAVVLCVWAWWPMLAAYPSTAILDGRAFHQMIAEAKWAVVHYHELPLWNPFDCHGIPMWDHPENITASPLLLVLSGVSATKTLMVWQLAHTLIGFVGMWLLARFDTKLSEVGSLIAAAFWAFASGHTTQYAGGHEALISFYDAPLLFFLWRRAEHDLRYAVGTGLALAWMVYDGATYPLPYTVVILGFESFCRFTSLSRALRVSKAAAVVGVVSFTVAASRLLPLMAQFRAHTRVMDGYPDVDHLSWTMLWQMYTVRSPAFLTHIPDQQYVWGEYLTYIGWLGVLLAFVGLVVSAFEQRWLALVGFFTLLLMAGHFAGWAPWSLLQKNVFPFKSMRVPSRFRLLLMMPISLWIALATERVPALVGRVSANAASAVRALLVAAALLVAGDVMGLGKELIEPRFTGAPEVPQRYATQFYYGGPGLTPDAIDQPRQNRAYLGCRLGTWAHYLDAPLWTGELPQARAIDTDAATVTSVTRTNNTFKLRLDVRRPTRILLNSAFDYGWRATRGRVLEDQKMLALDVEPGQYDVRVHYWPVHMTEGLVLTALGLVGSLAFLLRRRRT